MRATWRETFRSLHVRNYRLYATGQLISQVGGWMQIIGQDWLVLQLSHNSGTALGVITALQFAPVILLTLLGGKLADRFDKRLLLIAANVVWLVLASVMGALVLSGTVQLWHVMAFAPIWGTVSAMEMPIRQSFASELVGTDLLPNALALSAATFNTARIVGPAAAGVTIAAVGTGNVFLINAISYIGPVIALSRMRPSELYRAPVGASRDKARISDGLRYVRRRPDLIMPMALVLIIGMVGFNFQLTLGLMARTVFATGAASFGLFTTSLAIGALGGALAGTSRRGRPSAYVVLGAGVAFGALEAVVGFGPTYWAVALLLIPTGFFMVYFAQAANQRVQLGVDALYRGRVMALYALVFMGTTPVGAPLVGWAAEVFGARSGLWLGGLVSLVAAVTVLMYQLRRKGHQVRIVLRPLPRFYVRPVDHLTVAERIAAAARVTVADMDIVDGAVPALSTRPDMPGPRVSAGPAESAVDGCSERSVPDVDTGCQRQVRAA